MLFDKYWEMLFEICHRQTQDEEASEEMVQDIFISLWKRWDEVVINSSLEGYLIRSAKQKVIDYYREKYSVKQQSVKQQELDSLTPAQAQVTENEIEYEILQRHADNVIEMLPNQCQTVFKLSRQEHMTTKEIASALGVSQKTVKNHLTKALAHMRLHLIEKAII